MLVYPSPRTPIPAHLRFQVSVDIRAPQAGVILELCAAEGDSVDVGQDLVKLDTDGAAISESPGVPVSTTAESNIVEKSKTAILEKEPTPVAVADSRVPLIKFRYGKRVDTPEAETSFQATEEVPSMSCGLSIMDFPELFGRPTVTDEEALLIEMGGAI
jgi:pyruvate/2-oxoglutarate dehydrogenase complex dihydrolipoamide acyltransferase (E2) component